MTIADRLRHEPFTLALSSGFFGFYAHVGFLKALNELKLTPAAYTGSSAGAIVSAAAAQGLSVAEIESLVLRVSRKDFWDPYPGLGFLRGQKLENLLSQEISDDFASLKKPLRLSVFDIATRKTQIITTGPLASAIRASCAVPLLFHPVKIQNRFYWDGGIQDKMGIHGLPQKTQILSHYLEGSTRDPHSVYELKRDEQVLQSRGSRLIQIRLKGLPKAHPFALKHGPQIIAAAYGQAMTALQRPSRNST